MSKCKQVYKLNTKHSGPLEWIIILSAGEANTLNAVVTGEGKWEVSLAVPTEFTCLTKSCQYALPRFNQVKGEVHWSLWTKQYCSQKEKVSLYFKYND